MTGSSLCVNWWFCADDCVWRALSSYTSQAAWQRAEHSPRAADNKPIDSTSRWSWATGKTEDLKCAIHGSQKDHMTGLSQRSASGRPLSTLAPIPPGNKRKAGERGRTAASQTERKLFTMKAKMWRKRPFYLIPSCSCLVVQQVKDVCGGASLLRLWFGGVRLVLRLKLNRQLQTYRKGRAPWKGPGGWSSHLQENGASAVRIHTLMCSIWSLVSVWQWGVIKWVMKENELRSFPCISEICLLSREKEMGHLRGAKHTTVRGEKKEKRGEKDAGVSHKHAPFPIRLFSPPHLLQEEEKMSLNLGCSISASQLSGSHWWGWTRAGAPVASGQREDFGVFMVEGVHLGKAVRWWDCTWWINASSVCSHFLRLTNRKTPQPNSSSSRSHRGKKEKWRHRKYVRESPFCGAAQNTIFWLASVQYFIYLLKLWAHIYKMQDYLSDVHLLIPYFNTWPCRIYRFVTLYFPSGFAEILIYQRPSWFY